MQTFCDGETVVKEYGPLRVILVDLGADTYDVMVRDDDLNTRAKIRARNLQAAVARFSEWCNLLD